MYNNTSDKTIINIKCLQIILNKFIISLKFFNILILFQTLIINKTFIKIKFLQKILKKLITSLKYFYSHIDNR